MSFFSWKCGNCGRKLTGWSWRQLKFNPPEFCDGCGSRLTGTNAQPNRAEVQLTSASPRLKERKPLNTSKPTGVEEEDGVVYVTAKIPIKVRTKPIQLKVVEE